jgi:hypothetical protein
MSDIEERMIGDEEKINEVEGYCKFREESRKY